MMKEQNNDILSIAALPPFALSLSLSRSHSEIGPERILGGHNNKQETIPRLHIHIPEAPIKQGHQLYMGLMEATKFKRKH